MFCPGWILVGICTWISGKRMQTPTYNETTMTKPNGGLNLHPEWGFNWLNAMGDITSMMSENWGDKRMYSHSTNDISWYNQDRAWVMPSRVPRNDTLYYQKWPTTSHGSNRTLKLWLLSTSGVSKCVHDCLQYALSCMLIPVQSCPPLLKERLDCPLLLVASPFGVV
jgi:hypothetical protein